MHQVVAEEAARLMRGGGAPGQPHVERARALFEAARISRRCGLKLLEARADPDDVSSGGEFEAGVTLASHLMRAIAGCFAEANEDPDGTPRGASLTERGLYCDTAPDIAWEAAKWMPGNSDETARMLCIAGSWIKYEDPQAADVFYKALVRRCRKTAIGAEADRIRWFPLLDAKGDLKPKQPLSPAERAAQAGALRPSAAPTNAVDLPGNR